jgi:putative ABC transport system permease protein
VATYIISVVGYPGNPYFILGGIDPVDIDLLGAKIVEGRMYANDDEVVLGRIAAKNYSLGVGQPVTLGKKTYSIVGIFESGVTMQDGGAATTLSETQRLNSYTEGQVSIAMVKVLPGYEARGVADSVEASDSKLLSIVDVDDFGSLDQGLEILDSVSWAISVLAMVIGGIGVMNTIIMSVFERTREIGVLRAVGWKRRRVVGMILGEAVVVSFGAAVAGTFLGLAITWLMMQTSLAKAWLDISYEPSIFIQGLVVSLVVVIVGAVYPAYRAARFSPMEALRYE